MSPKSLVCLSVLVLAALYPPRVHAQQPQPLPPPTPLYYQPAELRQGLTFGFGLGVGRIGADCQDCDPAMEAGGIDGHFGFMIRPDLALLGEVWGMAHSEDRLTITHTIATVGAQYWVLPRLWIRAGVGVAHAAYYWDSALGVTFSDATDNAPAVMGAIGYEVIHKPHWALDLQLRGGTGFYSTDGNDGDYEVKGNSASLSVEMNWY